MTHPSVRPESNGSNRDVERKFKMRRDFTQTNRVCLI
jgi:hypothetical protein